MNESEVLRSVRGEINTRRRRGGALDVPGWLWERPEVAKELARTVTVARESGFDGDWEEASLNMESSMDALAAALLEAARNFPSAYPLDARRYECRYAPQMLQREDKGISNPSVVRYDVGGAALADYLSWRLREDGIADWCRRTICGGAYVTREEAWGFLTSDLPKVMATEDYEQLGLCPVHTRGRIRSEYVRLNSTLYATNMLRVHLKSMHLTATVPTLQSKTHTCRLEVCMPVAGRKWHQIKRIILKPKSDDYVFVTFNDHLPKSHCTFELTPGGFPHACPAPHFPNECRYVEGYGLSVMGDLIGSADLLRSSYPVSIWDMLEALLTGKFPPQSAVEIVFSETSIEKTQAPDEVPSSHADPDQFSALGPVTLTVQPWVTPEALADAWRECRRSKGYSPSVIQADALRFVLSHTPLGQTPQWECLARQWRQERGGTITRGQLHRLFERARNAVLPPCAETE